MRRFTICLLSGVCLSTLSSCLSKGGGTPPPTVSPCITAPAISDARERDLGLKLSADLAAGIGKPNLDITYKNKVTIAYAQLDQKAVEQLVLIEFLACIKKHHAKDVSAETQAVMEQALRVAILKAAGAMSYSGPLDPGTKSAVRDTQYGRLKLAKLEELGL